MEGLSYEEAIAELQTIMDKLQHEQVSIEQLSAQSERASALIHYCKNKLRDLATTLVTVEDTPGQ